jgi:hypothetical protein
MTLFECTTESENETILVGDRRKIISFACLNSMGWTNKVDRVQYCFTSRVVLDPKTFDLQDNLRLHSQDLIWCLIHDS